MHGALRGLALLAALASTGCAWRTTAPPPAHAAAPPAQPEIATGWSPKPGWNARRFMVAAAHPLAADAGREILQAGGSALDAAIAVQMVLALVEPQSSGIGGGAFLLHWDGRELQAWDGRETAPAAAGEGLFLAPDGQPLPFDEAVFGGRAVGTPGVLKMLEAAHRRHGRRPWARLFEPAIALAETGFAVGARLHGQLLADPHLRKASLARDYFYRPDGSPHPVGHVLRNPALAAVLRAVASHGSDALHRGPVAVDLVARVRGHAVPGTLSEADLAAYAPRQREPICTHWLEIYRVCGFPPPSSGHLAVMQILGMLERLPAPAPALQDGLPSPAWLHAYTEAARLAFADRAEYVADPDFVEAPGGDWKTLLAGAYLQQRAALIGPQSMQVARPGQPPGLAPGARAPMPEQPEHGTSHISVVDGEGRALALTSTIEAQFGARVMADGGTGLPGGYLLNNQLTDFSFTPADAAGRPVANRLQAGKRPRSSMSPTLVFDARDGRLLMSLGSPGGPAIIHFTAKTLLGTLAWGLDAQRAIELPNFGSFNGPTVLEAGRFPAATVEALRARGHRVIETALPSGVQAIQRTPAGWHGGADPRREGAVRGD
jgi:gamma-glutamyltranspeptidase/glutathione hydrolase